MRAQHLLERDGRLALAADDHDLVAGHRVGVPLQVESRVLERR